MSSQVAIIGAAGQLGSDLTRVLGDAAVPLGRDLIDLTEPERIAVALNGRSLRAVVNCAAYNLVDRAETEPELAFAVNTFGVRNLALWCAAHDVPLVHVSSDYVFGRDGSQCGPYSEDDPTGPVSAYGSSKLAGEDFVRALCPRHWVTRTCGLYGRPSAKGKGNFVETMLRLARERPKLRVVNDQVCTPTSTADLARWIVSLIETDQYGVYHATNAGSCSWFEFAAEIFRIAGLSPELQPISSEEYGAAARRPAYSVLDGSRLARTIGIELRSWQEAVREYVLSRPS